MHHFDDWLKLKLEKRLGGMVQEKILALQNLDPRMFETLSEEIVQAVCSSEELSEFRSSLLCQSSEVLSLEKSSFEESVSGNVSRRRNTMRTCSSVDSSPRYEKSEDLFNPIDKRGRNGHHSTSQQMQTLELLLKVPLSDIVSSANWPQLQQELCESLRDDNWVVFIQVLKVLARLSSSLAFNPVREGFLSLLEGLTLCYLTRYLQQQLPNYTHGIVLDNLVHRKIILISQCLLQILCEVPGKWIRYGEKRTQEIVDNFVDLLSMHTHHHRSLTSDQSKDILYPFHIFSILDPEAKWCACVTHAAFGRTILMKCVLKSSSLLRFIVEEVLIWLRGQMKLSEGVTAIYECGKNRNLNSNMINLAVFVHCISLLELFISSDKGYLLFPVLTSIQEEAVTVYSILLKILEFLNKVSNEPKVIHSKRVLKILEKVCASIILSRGTRILHVSSVELLHLLLEVPTGMDHYSLHYHNINILCKVSESPIAVKWMLGRPVRRTRDGISRALSDLRVSLSSASSSGRESALTNRTVCVARRIAKATTAAVRDRNRFTSDTTSPVCQLLSLCEQLFSTPEGYFVLESSEGQLIPVAGHLLIHVRNIMYNSDLGLLSIQRSLETFLIGMTLTPMGFLAICGVEGLLKCLIVSCEERSMMVKHNNPRLLHLLQLSTLVRDNKLHSLRRGLIKHALNQLWSSSDLESDWKWQERQRQLITVVQSICASPSVASEMLEDLNEDDESSASTLVEEVEPLSLRELLLRGLLSPTDDHIQEMSLNVMHSLAHNIDIAFVLQDKLNLKECLQGILSEAKLKGSSHESGGEPSPRRIIGVIDENARYSGHILAIMNQLRDTSTCDFYTMLRTPRSPRTHAHTSRPRVQTDLQRFLQDTRHGLHDNTWMSHARRAYRASCRSELKVPVLIELLEQILQTQQSHALQESQIRWPVGVVNLPLSQQQSQMIDMIIRYGCQIKALNSNVAMQHLEQLNLLLCQSKVFLGLEQNNEGFDWFVSSVFLMCAGSIDRSRSILQRVAVLPNGPFLWPLMAKNTMQLTASINQHLQGLVAEYVPKAYNVLLETGVPWWLVAEKLTHQAFLPAMPLSQLPHIIALLALHSWEYNHYMHTAILTYIQPALLNMSLHCSIFSLLAEIRLDNFCVGDYIPFMDKIAKLSRPQLVRDRIATATI